MDMLVIINKLVVVFILMAAGFAVGKFNVLTKDGNKTLTKLVLSITLPCTILSSVFENEMEITAGNTVYFLLMSLLTLLIAYLISLPVVRLMGGEKANRGLLHFMAVFSNSGFMGFPILLALFGVSSAYYVALFSVIFNVLVFSVGVLMIVGKSRDGSGFSLKMLLNPTLIVALLAIPIALTGLKFPPIITEAIRITGGMTIPGSMIIIGSSLAYVPIKTVFSEWRIFPVSLLKLVIIPFFTWLIMRQIISNEMMLVTLVILSGMPVAAMASILAIEYNRNERIASAGIFLTTLLSAITVPLLVYLLLM